LRRREYEVGDLVLAYPRKERFPKRQYNKLKMKKIGPCRILRKLSANAYELEMPTWICISPIFNVAYLYPYVVDGIGQLVEGEGPTKDLQWLKQMHVAQSLEFETILDTKVARSTRKKEYVEYFVKWKEHLVDDSTWMSVAEMEAKGFTVADFMKKGS
jgi:hypothetical protein